MQAGGRVMTVTRRTLPPTPRPPGMTWCHAVTLLIVLAGCGGSDRAEFTRATPVLVPADRPEWTGRTPGEEAVARVNGIAIPAGRYGRALAQAGEGTDPDQVLRALIAEESLAQEAARDPGFDAGGLRGVFERALAGRWLTRKFLDGARPEDMTDADLAPLWNVPAVQGRFNHLAIFVVQDYQWICCDGTPVHCATQEASACFAEGEAAVLATRDALQRLAPESEDLPLLLDDLKASAPRLAYQEYEFAWDERKRLQKGRTLFDDAVVNAVVSTPAGRFATTPVQSKFGWHLPFVQEVHPEVHKDLSDPDVRREIATTFLPRLRQRRFLDALADLIPAEGFLFLARHYEGFRRTSPPRLDVTFYPEALEAWERERTEVEGM